MAASEITISHDAIASFITISDSVISESPQMNESNTKFKLIQPFLEDILGWDRMDIESEYGVQMGGQTYHVDYALKIGDSPDVFVEVKGCDTPIRDTHVSQLQSYLKLKDVPWGLLTNGKEYRLYQLDVSDGSTELHLISDPSFDELNRELRAFSAITKTSIESGESTQIVENIRELNQAVRTLKNQKQPLAVKISNVITNETTELIYNEAEQESKKLVDNLLTSIESDRSSAGGGGDDPPIITEELPDISLGDVGDDPSAQVGIYPSNESGIEFLKTYNAWGFISIAQAPEYFMIYISKPRQEIQFIGDVDEVIVADDFVRIHDIDTDTYQYGESKKVVKFSDLYRLKEPIPLGGDNPHRMQGLLYTTLRAVQNADSTDDL